MLAAAGRRRRRRLAVRAHLARVLRADPLASPAGGRPRVQARVRRARLSQRPAAPRGVVPRADRLPDRRRGDAPAEHHRVHAQPAADDRGVVPGQGPAGRLAPGRALLRRHADRLRPRLEQRRLAVGGVDRLRRAAVFPDLQPGHAVGALRSATASSSAGTYPRSPRCRRRRSTRPGSCPRPPSRRSAWSLAATTRDRSSTTPARVPARWRSSSPHGAEPRRAPSRRDAGVREVSPPRACGASGTP